MNEAKVRDLLRRYDIAKAVLKAETTALQVATERVTISVEAHLLLQEAAQAVQQAAHSRIASIASRCLQAVFEAPYAVQITFERKRGRTEAIMTFERDGHVYSPEAVGGGVLDVAAFALRLAALVLTRPVLRRVLILDEPMRNIHGKGNRERVRALIQAVSKEMKVQIVMATGMDWLKCGNEIELGE